MWMVVAIIVFILLIVIYLGAVSSKNKLISQYMTGMFSATEEFLELADIPGMYLQIGDVYDSGITTETRRAYLLMHSNEKIITNRPIDMIISRPLSTFSPIYGNIEYKVELQDKGTEDDGVALSEIMPSSLVLSVSIGQNRITLSDASGAPDASGAAPTVYAEMYRTQFA